ncbi:MAG TPA: PRC-barrel domain-containing protein [Candidatus Sulfotelmatobacter sp.]|nr:PRC-barrel domain-containing protein [Candidatus Sulfotelmatobacter sp.]
MKIVPKLIAACATATLVGASALAQQDQQSQPSGQQSGQQTSTSSSQQQQQPSGGQQNEALQKANAQEFFRSSKIVGKSAQDQKGQKIGKIEDVVFNQQGEIFALIDVGNGKWAAVPWQVVNPASAKGKQDLTLNTTQQALKSAPAVSQDQWGSLNNPSFTQGIYSYYKIQQPGSAMGGASEPGGAMQGQGSSSSQPQPDQQQQQQEQQKQDQQSHEHQGQQ